MNTPTIADMIRTKPDPYAAAIACFSSRDLDRGERTVTFHFEDRSVLTFKIKYEVAE